MITYNTIKDYILENFGFHVQLINGDWGYKHFIPLGNKFFTLSQVLELTQKFQGYYDSFQSGGDTYYTYRINKNVGETVDRKFWD